MENLAYNHHIVWPSSKYVSVSWLEVIVVHLKSDTDLNFNLYKSRRLEVLCKKGVRKNFSKFTGNRFFLRLVASKVM